MLLVSPAIPFRCASFPFSHCSLGNRKLRSDSGCWGFWAAAVCEAGLCPTLLPGQHTLASLSPVSPCLRPMLAWWAPVGHGWCSLPVLQPAWAMTPLLQDKGLH